MVFRSVSRLVGHRSVAMIGPEQRDEVTGAEEKR
jgi:hypothetical protein